MVRDEIYEKLFGAIGMFPKQRGLKLR